MKAKEKGESFKEKGESFKAKGESFKAKLNKLKGRILRPLTQAKAEFVMPKFIILDSGNKFTFDNKKINKIIAPKNIKIKKYNGKFIIEGENDISACIKVYYDNNKFFTTIGVYNYKASNKTVSSGIISSNDNSDLDFYQDFDNPKTPKYINSIYFNCNVFNSLGIFSKSVDKSLTLGVKNIFFVLDENRSDADLYNARLAVIVDLLVLKKEECEFLNYYVVLKGNGLKFTDVFKGTSITLCISISISPRTSDLISSSADKGIFDRRAYSIASNLKQSESNASGTLLAIDASFRENKKVSVESWEKYCYFISRINYYYSGKDLILYNLQPGQTNNSIEVSNYTNKIFKKHTNTNCDYSSSATLFFFGGTEKCNKTESISIHPKNLDFCESLNIKFLLFGDSRNGDTCSIPRKKTVNLITDKFYTISKINEDLI